MGLAELQSALARLYTDVRERECLFADAAHFGSRHGLSEMETRTLACEVLPAAQRLSASLLRKRILEAARAMPLARESLGARFMPAFQQFATITPLGPMRNPALDALAFLRWFLEQRDFVLSAGERRALRYIQAWLVMQQTPRRFLIRVLHLPGTAGKRVSCAIWFRWGGRLRHHVIGWPRFGAQTPAAALPRD